MCRLLLANKKGIDEIDKRYGLAEFLKYLEKSCGGHGNGVALLYQKSKKIEIKKGVNFRVEEAAELLKRKKYDWCIFHTRLASAGGISDKNCHPFKKGEDVIAMNGTETGLTGIAKHFDKTDTEIILELAKFYKMPLPKFVSKFNSVFVGFHKFKPFVFTPASYKDLQILYVPKKDALVFASEFPSYGDCNDIYEPAEFPFLWNGRRIKNFEIKPAQKRIVRYNYYNYYDYNKLSRECEIYKGNSNIYITKDNNTPDIEEIDLDFEDTVDNLLDLDYELDTFLEKIEKKEIAEYESEKFIFPKENDGE